MSAGYSLVYYIDLNSPVMLIGVYKKKATTFMWLLVMAEQQSWTSKTVHYRFKYVV